MQIDTRRGQGIQNNRQGVHLVEMAFVLPIVLTMILGIIQVGYLLMVSHLLQDAARQGCRQACLRLNRSNASVTSSVNSWLRQVGVDPSNATVTILVNNNAADVSTAIAGDDVIVKVSVPSSTVAIVPELFTGFSGHTVEGVVTLRCE